MSKAFTERQLAAYNYGMRLQNTPEYCTDDISDTRFMDWCEGIPPFVSHVNSMQGWTEVDCVVYDSKGNHIESTIGEP